MSPTATDPRSVLLTGEQAIERVRAFVNAPDLTGDLSVQGPTDGALIRFYEVAGRNVLGSVNAHDGTIATLFMRGIIQPGGTTIDAERAVAVAEEFLVAHGVPFAGLDRAIRLQDHGESSEYIIEWRGRVGDVIVPNSREVGIDGASGRVFRYSYLNLPFQPPPQPAIDRATAEASAIRAATGSPQADVSQADLMVTFAPSGMQRLVWQIYVDDGLSHAIVEVDAETGAATIIGRG